MAGEEARPKGWRQLYINTPTVESISLSKMVGCPVFLKLENVQRGGSFKIRGISNLCQNAVLRRGCTHLYSASGGNAGLAAAHACRLLGVPVSVVLPHSTPDFVEDMLRDTGAEVLRHGKVWDEANLHAQKLAAKPNCEYVHPFEHPDIWAGHATLVQEAAGQLAGQLGGADKPGVVVLSVGGGGLLNGVVQGMDAVGWRDVPIVAMETEGADCLNAAVKAGKPVTLPDISSVAKCLGALTVSSSTLQHVQSRQNIHSLVVPDREAIRACLNFANEHHYLVEPACGAALAAVYSGQLGRLQQEGRLPGQLGSVLVVVCGGSLVSLDSLAAWRQQFHI